MKFLFLINKKNALQEINKIVYIQNEEDGRPVALVNPAANGNAWFVEKVDFVNSADEAMKALDSLDTKNVAIYNVPALTKGEAKFETYKDSLSKIQLKVYQPNYLKYISTNTKDGFAVFSEMYYHNGWKATIDGKETKIYNVDYVLRGLPIPAGKHTIEFTFEPQVVKTGSTIALMSSIGMIFLVIGGIYFETKKTKN